MQMPTMLEHILGDELKEKLKEAMKSVPGDKTHLQLKVEAYNNVEGDLGYVDCPKCKNKGLIAVINDQGEEVIRNCSCMKIRKLHRNLERSGLQGMYEQYNLENYGTTKRPWQKDVLLKTGNYVKAVASGKNYWLYVGGQTGSGKSHICVAAAGRLIALGKSVVFKLWQEIAADYRARTYREDDRKELFHELFECDVLYIDDFLKVHDRNMIDYNYDLAFQVLTGRYNARKPTIISTELLINELAAEDSALGGRINQMSGGGEYIINIEKIPENDMRRNTKGAEEHD